MKIIFSILIIILTTFGIVYAEKTIRTIASVNDTIITNIDIENEIFLIDLLKYDIKNENKKIIALENLITDSLKEQDIKNNQIQVDPAIIKSRYETLIYELEKINKISEIFKKKIYSKIELETGWNMLIRKKYIWKISVNINEIENKIKNNENKKINEEEKNKIINQEKNKKLQIYSANHLSNLRANSLIKIY